MITRYYFYSGYIKRDINPAYDNFCGIISIKSLFPNPNRAHKHIIKDIKQTAEFNTEDQRVVVSTMHRV